MAENTKISWTRSTWNPWIGCTKVGPGCDHCYAENQDSRKRWGGVTHWGAGVPRYRTSASNWAKPLQWNRQAASEHARGIGWAGPQFAKLPALSMDKPFWPVFCASLADVFDNEVPNEWRRDLFNLIEATPNLSWLLVTKRIGNVPKMAPASWLGENPLFKPHWPKNCRLMITIVNQEEADRDIPKLLALPCKNGISYEPALGPVNWSPYLKPRCWQPDGSCTRGDIFGGRIIEWIIVGGESSQPGHPAREFHIQWMRSTVRQGRDAGVPVFDKQLGSNVIWNGMQDADTCWPGAVPPHTDTGNGGFRLHLKDRAGADPAEWPEDLRVREFPL